MRNLTLGALLLAGCSTGFGYDPVLQASGPAEVREGDCAADVTCISVRLEALPEAAGRTADCELYGPGDPDTLEPLASGDVPVPPASTDDPIVLRWDVDLPGDVDVATLNPVCGPMVEG